MKKAGCIGVKIRRTAGVNYPETEKTNCIGVKIRRIAGVNYPEMKKARCIGVKNRRTAAANYPETKKAGCIGVKIFTRVGQEGSLFRVALLWAPRVCLANRRAL